jgi:C4-dicarboxylate-specific signal transduction histidine kinase
MKTILNNSIDIFTERDVENREIYIKTYRIGDSFMLEIGDSGGGVPDDIMDIVFDPYFTSKSSKRDSDDIGLYMSRIIIEEHCKGNIFVENGEGGANFRIRLVDLES